MGEVQAIIDGASVIQNGSATQSAEDATRPNAGLLQEIKDFRESSGRRYSFNNRWDIVLSLLGIALSISVVAAGFAKRPLISALLGALIGATVTAQKAFPFGQRAMFYRLLIGQTDNLITTACHGLISTKDAIDRLSALRMDFAQQLPRGSTATTDASLSQPS